MTASTNNSRLSTVVILHRVDMPDATAQLELATPNPPVVLRQLETQGMPELPADPDGRHMSWVMVLAGPDVHYHGEVRSWDLTELVDAYETYTAGGFEAPVLAEHDPSVTVGKRLGDLVEIREHDGGLIGMVRWAIPDASELIESGQIRYTSPGIGSIEMHDTGDVLETVYEISVVTSPHQRGAQTHVLAKGVVMPEDKGYTDEEVEDLEEEEEEMSLASRVEVLEAALARLQAEDEDDEEDSEDSEDSDEEEEEMAASAVELENAQLKAENAELRVKDEFATFAKSVVVGSTFEVTEGNLDALFLLHTTDAAAFGKLAATSKLPENAAPAKMASIIWAERIGSGEVVEPASAPSNAVELKSLCLAEAGGDKKRANALYLERAPKLGIL